MLPRRKVGYREICSFRDIGVMNIEIVAFLGLGLNKSKKQPALAETTVVLYVVRKVALRFLMF